MTPAATHVYDAEAAIRHQQDVPSRGALRAACESVTWADICATKRVLTSTCSCEILPWRSVSRFQTSSFFTAALGFAAAAMMVLRAPFLESQECEDSSEVQLGYCFASSQGIATRSLAFTRSLKVTELNCDLRDRPRA